MLTILVYAIVLHDSLFFYFETHAQYRCFDNYHVLVPIGYATYRVLPTPYATLDGAYGPYALASRLASIGVWSRQNGIN